MSEEIDEKDLPQEGNSKARLYPPVEEAEAGGKEDDAQQPASGDAAAERGDQPEPAE
jgi:hypothetical protein